MARILGPTTKDVAAAHDYITPIARRAAHDVIVTVADRLHGVVTVDDVASITSEWRRKVDDVLLPKISEHYERGATITHANQVEAVRQALTAGPAPAADYNIPLVRSHHGEQQMANARNRLVNVGNTIWEDTRSTLLEGMQNGLGIEDLKAQLVNGGAFGMARAEVIARTEISKAMNQGSLAQMDVLTKAAGASGVTKEWITVMDGRERVEHGEMDGVKIAIDETFSIGFDPGDDYNCRCTLGYDMADDDLASYGSSDDALDNADAGTEEDSRDTVLASGTGGVTMAEPVIALADGYEPEPYEPQPDETVKCPECGKMDAPDAVFCDQCGTKLEGRTDVSEMMTAEGETEDLGGKPNQGTKPDKRLKENKGKTTPNSSTADNVVELAAAPASEGEAEQDTLPSGNVAPLMAMAPMWRGALTIEGTATGDGREFANGALTWGDPPLPLRWQKQDSHGGMPTNVTVNVGTINRVWRDESTGQIMGEGVFDLGGPDDDDAHEAYRQMQARGQMGVSIDADDITDADIEYVFPDAEEGEEDDLFMLLFAAPEKMIFHSARIRAATMCDIPAFIDAQLSFIPEDEREQALAASALALENAFGAVGPHTTATSDGSWDGPANEARLESPLPVATAKKAYAWIDDAEVQDGEVAKSGCKFIHHEVNADGTPGDANLTACSTGIGVLNGGRGGTTIPDSDKQGVYNHLARHLRDAGQEPPPFEGAAVSITAGAGVTDWRPPRDWFENPNLGQVMPIMVSEAGRVYGHAAQWGQCHIGYAQGGECIMPPFEEHHDHYMTGEIICDDGTRVAVGQITAGIEHAPLYLSAASAKDHYENTDAVVADVVIGNDKYGIWVAGAIRPWAHNGRTHALRASGQVSPDWRRIGGALRMVALLTVNTSGYQVSKPRSRSFVAGGVQQTLVASGMVNVRVPQGPSEEELNRRAMQIMREQLAKRVHKSNEEV